MKGVEWMEVAGTVLVILAACVDGAVIPRGNVLADGGSSSVQSGGGGSNSGDGSVELEEGMLDKGIMFFALLFMLLIYLIACGLYISIRWVMERVILRHRIGMTLLRGEDDEDVEANRNRRHRRNRRVANAATSSADVFARWPSVLDDEEMVQDKLALLPVEEQFYYKQGEEYIRQNPPLLITQSSTTGEFVDPIMNEQTKQFIEEEGATAWEFQPDANLPNDTILVENKIEVTFLNYNYDASVMTNLPIPCINRVYYCEFKIFELNNSGVSQDDTQSLKDGEYISFGLATSPYPYFRLPGRHHHSIAYDSSGARRFNDSFKLSQDLASLFPQCEKGDVIGIGYRSHSGTVFFTRNGKKLNEKAVGGHIKGWKFRYLYPIIGSNVPCKIHANFGTYGFVYIEANVKKWGYAKSNGMKLPPPSYEEYGQDTLLESGYEDDELSDNESNFSGDILDSNGELLPPPPGFEYSTSPGDLDLDHEEIDLDSFPVQPPSYSEDEHTSTQIPAVGTSNGLLANATPIPDTEVADEDGGYDDEDEEDEEDEINEMDYLVQKDTSRNTLANQFIQ